MNLQRTGFHIVELKRYMEVENKFSNSERIGIIPFLTNLAKGKLEKFSVIVGLDGFLKNAANDAILSIRNQLNLNITNILAIGASVVFVVECDILNIPDNPSIHSKPLISIIPRLHDVGSLEPGYLYYPVF